MSIATLPWYDLPELHHVVDEFWSAIARRLRHTGVENVPNALTRNSDCRAAWRVPDLVLSQCCGYDFVTDYRADLTLIATPQYAASGCKGPYYSSIIVVSSNYRGNKLTGLRGTTCAVNEMMSHSGMNALRNLIAPLAMAGKFFGDIKVTRSHIESLAAIVDGTATVAAIDCITYALIQKHCPWRLDGTVPLCTTPIAPAPPFVTGKNAPATTVAALKEALQYVFSDPTTRLVREALLMEAVVDLPAAAYDHILEFERDAQRFGYPELC